MSVSDVSGKAIANLATEELKHPAPVFHGDTLFCESEVLEKKESKSKPDRGTVKVHTRVLNQDGVLVAEFKRLVLVPRREPGARARRGQRRVGLPPARSVSARPGLVGKATSPPGGVRYASSRPRPEGVFCFPGHVAARTGGAQPVAQDSESKEPPAPHERHRSRTDQERATAGVGSGGCGDDRTRRDPLVRRQRRGVRPALRAARRGGDLRAALRRQAARTPTWRSPIPATSRASRTARSSARRPSRKPARPTTGATRPRCGRR